MKRYLSDCTYESSPKDRLDRKIEHLVKGELVKLDRVLGELAPTESVLGLMVSKWTFMRVPFSFDVAITCAQRGALFESLAIVRMILEQVAWSLDVRGIDDFDEIASRRTYHSIRVANAIHPAAGRLYGWLSAHAHWVYDAHIKAFESTDSTIGMRLANSLYKAQALGAILTLFAIVAAGYRCLFEALGSASPSDERVARDALSLLRELHALVPDDQDVQLLLTMLESSKRES